MTRLVIPLALSVLAHVLADFLFQTDAMANEKNNVQMKGFLKHWCVVFVTLLVLMLPFKLTDVLMYCLVLSLFHILIDVFKAQIESRRGPATKFVMLIVDQFLHLVLISFLLPISSFTVSRSFSSFIGWFSIHTGLNLSSLPVQRILLITIVYLYVLFAGAVFIRKLFDLIYKNVPDYLQRIAGDSSVLDNVKTGKVIGIFERLLILTLYLTGNVASITIVIAAKSLARFKNFENKDFAEYYLIGTLASVMIAMVGGMILKVL
ncbi:MAG TPA: DUF3307 domain-containing protein [Mesotoga sp.]|nr:DUF3307 domain-containing protein [Mesotoga sp.]